MESKMLTIPKFLRLEPSPRVQDSAFPPFKVEHRYKGVYERAGFEVFKGQNAQFSPRSRAESTFSSARSNMSPTQNQSHYFHNAYRQSGLSKSSSRSTTQNIAGHSKKGSLSSYKSKSEDILSRTSPTNQNNPYGQPTSRNPYGQSYSQSHSQLPDQSYSYSNAHSNYNYSKSQPNTAYPADSFNEPTSRNYLGSTAVASVNEPVLLHQNTHKAANSEFNFNVSPSLNNRNYMGLSLDLKKDQVEPEPLSDDTIDDTNHLKTYYDTNATSLQLLKEWSHAQSVDTNELLDTPEKKKETLGRTDTMPSDLNEALSDFRNDYQATKYDSTVVPTAAPTIQVEGADAAANFESFKTSNNLQSNTLNLDYQQFLTGNLPTSDLRKSQLSMVSSILSKESRYSEEEDAGVQKELERQLASLKATGSSDLLAKQPEKEPTAPYPLDSPIVNESSVPYPQEYAEDRSVPTFTVQSPGSDDSIKPLTVRHSIPKREVELPDISQTPKVKDQPFADPIDQLESDFAEVKLNRASVPSFKYPSGSGPCRTCGERIDSAAKGPKKAVYSKTSELTGQWHRECFKCAHQECSLQFNKNVQCYVIDDEAYCHHHYHTLNGSLCENCRTGIEGECIENELLQKWHLHCLKCVKCREAIKSDYYVINDLIFCEKDAYSIISGEAYSDAHGNYRNGLSTNDKIEKRRTRLMHID